MTSAIKKIDARSKTGENDISLIRALKQELTPKEIVEKNSALEKLKSEQASINSEMDKIKAETVKKSDENTRIYNLRQAELLKKIEDLESRKEQTEKDLNLLMQQKNSTLHDDLRRVTRFLVNETKKIAPLEKEIESGVSKIADIKSGIQLIFESQSKELLVLSEMIKSCTTIINDDFHKISQEIQPLFKQKIDYSAKVSELESKLATLNVEFERKSLKLKELETQLSQYSEFDGMAETTQLQLIEMQEKKQNLQKSIEISESNLQEIENSGRKLENSISFLHDQYERKKIVLSNLDNEVTSIYSRINSLKAEEITLNQSLSNYQSQTNQLQTEVASLKTEKNALLHLLEESRETYQQRRQHFQTETELLTENSELKAKQIQQDFQELKYKWDEGFKNHCFEKEKSLKEDLAQIEQHKMDQWASSQKQLLKGILEIVMKNISRETFTTSEQKIQSITPELQALIEEYSGGKTLKKWWKFW